MILVFHSRRIDSGEKVFARVGTPAFWAPEAPSDKKLEEKQGGRIVSFFFFCQVI